MTEETAGRETPTVTSSEGRMQSRVNRAKCSPSREGTAKGLCTFGIVGIAAGGGLVFIYMLTVYTDLFRGLTNPEILSIPGFCLLFGGRFSSYSHKDRSQNICIFPAEESVCIRFKKYIMSMPPFYMDSLDAER